MAEKILKTRFQLRHDTLAAWTSENPELKKGEIAVATIDTANPANKLNPPVMFKVGPGNFNDLGWASALAADVYAWAKGAGLPVDETEIADGEYVTGLDWDDTNSILRIKKATLIEDIAANGTSKKAATTAAIKAYVDSAIAGVIAQGTVVAAGEKIDVAQEGNVYTVSHEAVAPPAESEGTGRKYLTGVTTDGYGHITGFTTATEVDQELPTEDDFGVLTITGKEAIKVTAGQNPEVSLALDNSGNVQFTQSDDGLKGDVARVADADHADAATKVDKTLTVKVGSATKTFDGSAEIEVDVDAAIAAAIEAEGHPEYSIIKDATSEYAATYHLTKDGVNIGAAINIPKDLVVESGKVETLEAGVWGEAGTYIVLTLANATNDKIYVNVGSLIEYVTSGSTANDQVIVNIDDNHKVTATIGAGKVGTTELADKAVTEDKLEDNVQSALVLARTALQEHQDISGKKDKQEVYGVIGNKTQTITKVWQDENGEITVTYEDIAFPAAPVVNDGKFTVTTEGDYLVAATGEMTANQSGDTSVTIKLTEAAVSKIDGALQAVMTNDNAYLDIEQDNGGVTINLTEKTTTSLGKVDTAVQSVTAPAGSGLKAERTGNDIVLNFDEDVIFVFDGGNAAGWETANA